jgi:hypothetical protein
VPERATCMETPYKGEEFTPVDPTESIVTILGAYATIENQFPSYYLL